jgi:HlyD family secretion protein
MTRKSVVILILVAVALGGTAVYAGWLRRDTALEGSGTVEARDIRVGSKVGGRIDKVLVREGDRVASGQTLITFDDQELLASLEQSRAAAQKAKRGFRPEEIREARAAAAQAKADYELRVNGYRKEDIAAAQSDVDRAAADEVRARLDFERYQALAQKDLISRQQRDAAEASWKMALAQLENYQHKLEELKRGYRPEEIASAEAHYRETEATLDKFERGNRREDIDLAGAAYAYDQARFRERQVVAPSTAIVEVLDVRPGDIISPNTPVARSSSRIRFTSASTFRKRSSGVSNLGKRRKCALILFRKRYLKVWSSKSTNKPSFFRAMCKHGRNAFTRSSASRSASTTPLGTFSQEWPPT